MVIHALSSTPGSAPHEAQFSLIGRGTAGFFRGRWMSGGFVLAFLDRLGFRHQIKPNPNDRETLKSQSMIYPWIFDVYVIF